MLSVRTLILGIGFLFLPLIARAHIDYPDEKKQEDQLLVETCRTKPEGVYSSEAVICLKGSINDAVGLEVKEAIAKFPQTSLVFNSLGGDASTAISIGRVMHAEKTRLIIDGICHSSCANYIAPAAFRIVVWDHSVIMMHGSFPRSFYDFFSSYPNKPESNDINVILNSNEFASALRLFPKHIASNVVDETLYFSEIGPNEQYLHRYWEVERNVRLYGNQKCQPKTGFDLVVGPKYADHFLFTNIEYFWWPDKQQVIDAAGFRKDDAVIVLDMDLMPSWIPGIGIVTQAECLKPLSD